LVFGVEGLVFGFWVWSLVLRFCPGAIFRAQKPLDSRLRGNDDKGGFGLWSLVLGFCPGAIFRAQKPLDSRLRGNDDKGGFGLWF